MNDDEPGKDRPGFMEILKKIRGAQKAGGYHGRSIAEMREEEARRKREEDEYETHFPDIPVEVLP